MPLTGVLSAAAFAAALDPLGPFEPAPRLALAVSGGADSMALALLAAGWAHGRDGNCLALVVDHGLRAGSAAEAALTTRRLAARGIAARVLTLRDLTPGPALAERARAARYAALEAACADAGILHLLLGHHAGDQAETVAMRMLRGSGADGLAGMSALVETAQVRLLRPLLGLAPVRLRATLRACGMEWVEDPSNRDMAALRARLRALRADPDGTGLATLALSQAAAARGLARRLAEASAAVWLGRHARLHPDGFAVLDMLPEDPRPLAALLRIVAGGPRPPPAAAVARWLGAPRPATLGGVALRRAGARLGVPGGGWLLCREAAAMAQAVPARPGAVWDGRFRLPADGPAWPPEARLGPAAGYRRPPGVPLLAAATVGAVHGSESPGRPCWWPRAPLAGAGFVAAPAMPDNDVNGP